MSMNNHLDFLPYLFFNIIIMKLITCFFLNSSIHIPTYAGLLSVSVVSIFWIAIKPFSNIFCVTKLGFDVHFKKYFSCLPVLCQICFSKFLLVYHIQHCWLICRMFFYLCHHFFYFHSFFVSFIFISNCSLK